MKENINTSSHTFSHRSREILSDPKHSGQKEKKEKWSWTIVLESQSGDFQSDKILTLVYSNLALSEFDSLFLETLSRLCLGKKVEFLVRINFREIENFLRDENHQPAFTTEEENLPEKSFKEVKNSLLAAIILRKMRENKDGHSWPISWNDLSLVEKNRQMTVILEDLNKLFSRGKLLHLILAEQETVTLMANGFPLDLEVVENVLNEIFHGEGGGSCLKVVAAL